MGRFDRLLHKMAEGDLETAPLVADMMKTRIDPVCGMEVNKETAKVIINYEGQTIYFCCPSCQRRFQRNPMKHIDGAYDRKGHGEGM